MRIQLFCILIMFVFIAGINLDTFAENTNNSDTKTTTVLVVGHQSTIDFSIVLAMQFALEHRGIEVLVAPSKRETSNSPYILPVSQFDFLENHFLLATNEQDRSDSNFLTTSFLLQPVQRSYSDISVKDRARRNTNVVPQNKNIPSPTRTDIS